MTVKPEVGVSDMNANTAALQITAVIQSFFAEREYVIAADFGNRNQSGFHRVKQ